MRKNWSAKDFIKTQNRVCQIWIGTTFAFLTYCSSRKRHQSSQIRTRSKSSFWTLLCIIKLISLWLLLTPVKNKFEVFIRRADSQKRQMPGVKGCTERSLQDLLFMCWSAPFLQWGFLELLSKDWYSLCCHDHHLQTEEDLPWSTVLVCGE